MAWHIAEATWRHTTRLPLLAQMVIDHGRVSQANNPLRFQHGHSNQLRQSSTYRSIVQYP